MQQSRYINDINTINMKGMDQVYIKWKSKLQALVITKWLLESF